MNSKIYTFKNVLEHFRKPCIYVEYIFFGVNMKLIFYLYVNKNSHMKESKNKKKETKWDKNVNSEE